MTEEQWVIDLFFYSSLVLFCSRLVTLGEWNRQTTGGPGMRVSNRRNASQQQGGAKQGLDLAEDLSK